MSSRFVARGTPEARRARLLAAALADVARLEAAEPLGWDVAQDLETARRQVAAFTPPTGGARSCT